MGRKRVETTPNTNNAFGPRTAIEMYKAVVVQEVLQRKQEEPWRWGARWPVIGSLQWPFESNHRSWSSYNYMRSCLRTQLQPFYSCNHSVFGIWSELERWKSSASQYFMSCPQIKTAVILKCHLLCNNEPFLNQIVLCHANWVLVTRSLVVVRRLSCPMAGGILVPWPGIRPTSPVLESRFPTTGSPGKSQENIF